MKKYNDVILYKVTRPIITVLVRLIFRPKIIGAENIPNFGKVILAGNHTSNLDCILLISSIKRNIHFLAKDELFKGVKKIIFSNFGLIPVNRKIKDKSVLINASKYLENGCVVGIFPEGTTEKGKSELLPFKIGAVKLSYDTNTTIIPFKISGKYRIFSNNLKIIFDKPFIACSNLDKSNEDLKSIIDSMKESE